MSSSAQQQVATPVDVVVVGPAGVGKAMFLKQLYLQAFDASSTRSLRRVEIYGIPYAINVRVLDCASAAVDLAPDRWPVFILMFDLTSRDSLDDALRMWDSIQRRLRTHPPPVVCLVGNKCDCCDGQQVTFEQARRAAAELGSEYFEASGLRNIGVESALAHVIRKYELAQSAPPPAYGTWENDNDDDDDDDFDEAGPPPASATAYEELRAEPARAWLPPAYEDAEVGFKADMSVQVGILGDVRQRDKRTFARLFASGVPPGPGRPPPAAGPWTRGLRVGGHACELHLQGLPTAPLKLECKSGAAPPADHAEAFVVLFSTARRDSFAAAQAAYVRIARAKAAARLAGARPPLPTPVVLVGLDTARAEWRRVEADEVHELAAALNCACVTLDMRGAGAAEGVADLAQVLAARVARGRANAARLGPGHWRRRHGGEVVAAWWNVGRYLCGGGARRK